MIKLYYSKGACSLSPHIALHEARLTHTAILVSTKNHQLADGSDYYVINPLGYVPLLELVDGTRLTEGPAIVQYIADQAPATNLAPAHGTMERYHLQSWLNFISTELHKGFSPLFNPSTPAEYAAVASKKLISRLAYIDAQLTNKTYLMGENFTVADAYLFTVSNWTAAKKIDISALSNLLAYRARVAARAGVQAAMQAEGLL